MFSRFETENGAIYVRSIDIRRLENLRSGGTLLVWDESNERMTMRILETADENMARLRQEETAALIASEKLRQRQAQGYPPEPIQRGRQSMRMVSK